MTTEAALAAIAALASTDPGADIESELRALLNHRSNFVIGKAVKLVQERNITGAAPELIKAFAYFMDDCVQRDPGCSAKLAIANCLSTFGEAAWDVYLAGVRHVQKEPAWGKPFDTAATLRGICGRALMAMGHHDAFRWHAVLLADSEPMTRTLAVETLGGVPDERAELLLRCKIAREPDTNVEMDAFEGLMRIAPDESFDFVAGYLYDEDPDRVRGAALALGQTHQPEAFAALRERWASARGRDEEIREALALPIALVRSGEAFAFLLEALAGAPGPLAMALIEALALYRETPARAGAVQRAVEKRKNRTLSQTYRKYFENSPAGE